MEREVFGLVLSLTANEYPPPKGLLEHVEMQRCLQEKSRFLSPLELMSSQVLPVSNKRARICMAPKLELGKVPSTQIAKMSGNSMNVPCVAAILLTAIFALDYH